MRTNSQTHGISRSAFLRTVALTIPAIAGSKLLAQQSASSPPSTETNVDLGKLRSFVELARSDIRTEKSYVIAQNLPLSDKEAEGFWPLHREYDLEYTRLLDERLSAIIQFAKQYDSMTDADATTLAEKTFELENKRTALKKKFFPKFSKVIPALKAARFFQIENQLNMLLDLQVASSLPLIKT